MAEVIAERVRHYILDGSDEDLRRLLSIAEISAEMARSAFARVGMQEGWHAIDCGCGPIGGLAVMAEMVGPAGRVVGVDFLRRMGPGPRQPPRRGTSRLARGSRHGLDTSHPADGGIPGHRWNPGDRRPAGGTAPRIPACPTKPSAPLPCRSPHTP